MLKALQGLTKPYQALQGLFRPYQALDSTKTLLGPPICDQNCPENSALLFFLVVNMSLACAPPLKQVVCDYNIEDTLLGVK